MKKISEMAIANATARYRKQAAIGDSFCADWLATKPIGAANVSNDDMLAALDEYQALVEIEIAKATRTAEQAGARRT